MELDEQQLKNIMAGANKEISEKTALENSDLFRDKKIQQLKNKKENLSNLKKDLMEENSEKYSFKSR